MGTQSTQREFSLNFNVIKFGGYSVSTGKPLKS